jgi:hypothetical protein
MTTYLDIAWTSSSFTPPTYKLMESKKRWFIVIDDSASIITVMSKTRTVYTIAKSILEVKKTDEDVDYYYLDNPRYLKVISCTDNTAIKPRQLFVQSNLLKYI